MRHGFVKTAAITPKIRVADTVYNGQIIMDSMEEASKAGAKLVVFPELCITGYTCGDLFWQNKLITAAKEELINAQNASDTVCEELSKKEQDEFSEVKSIEGIIAGIEAEITELDEELSLLMGKVQLLVADRGW